MIAVFYLLNLIQTSIIISGS